MKEKLLSIFRGRQGMDELSKALFWAGLAVFFTGLALGKVFLGVPGTLLRFAGLFSLITAFMRAFSRRLDRREVENRLFLGYLSSLHRKRQAAKERRRQSKEYRFYKCPGCGKWLRVPRGQGRIHINCSCGYTLYRKS